MPRSMSIKHQSHVGWQSVESFPKIMIQKLDLRIPGRYHGEDVKKRWAINTKQNQNCSLIHKILR